MACTTPATGVRPPLVMLVIVRAIGSCDGYSAEEGDNDISHTLPYQFGVGGGLGTCHTVGNGCRKKRFDGSEHGDGECRWEEEVDVLHSQCESVYFGEVGGHAAEPVAYGGYRQ